jgi:hypothetical protein
MAAQKATELRRLLAEVEANDRDLRRRQDELEAHLVAAPTKPTGMKSQRRRATSPGLFAVMVPAHDTRRQKLIAAVLAELEWLSEES